MKKLTDITMKDAIAVIQAGYPELMENIGDDWDLSTNKGEMCMSNKFNPYKFWFFTDHIAIGVGDQIFTFFDVKLVCYIRAVELGYSVPAIKAVP